MCRLAEAKLPDLNNRGVWIKRGGTRLRICGVGDLWTDRQDLNEALGDATESDAVLLLSHNPDFVETIRDSRVGLVLSGHTHGGQIVLPGYGAPDRAVSLRAEISLWTGPRPILSGFRHPWCWDCHPACSISLPA